MKDKQTNKQTYNPEKIKCDPEALRDRADCWFNSSSERKRLKYHISLKTAVNVRGKRYF